MPFTIAIVGRPNVGKSTLFNRLVGRRAALVDDTPGLTRDWRSGEGGLGDLSFTVIDTAGLEDAAPRSLEARMRRQTERAVERADVVLFDPDDFRDRATYGDPHRFPTGTRTTVLINGTVVVRDTVHTGALPGKVLRRDADGRVQ